MALTADTIGIGRSGIGGGMASGMRVAGPTPVKVKKTVKKPKGAPVKGGSKMTGKPDNKTAARGL